MEQFDTIDGGKIILDPATIERAKQHVGDKYTVAAVHVVLRDGAHVSLMPHHWGVIATHLLERRP